MYMIATAPVLAVAKLGAEKWGGGGTNFFPEKWKAKKKKKKRGHSGAAFKRMIGYCRVFLPQKIFTELGTKLCNSRHF